MNQYVHAPLLTRFAAFCVDVAICLFILFILLFCLMMIVRPFGVDKDYLQFSFNLLGYLVFCTYFISLECLRSSTVGQKLLKLKVISLAPDNKIRLKQSIIRTFPYTTLTFFIFIWNKGILDIPTKFYLDVRYQGDNDFITMTLGISDIVIFFYLYCFTNKERISANDKLADCRVVKV